MSNIDELREGLARIEEDQAKDGNAGGTYVLAAYFKPRGGGQEGQGHGWREDREARRVCGGGAVVVSTTGKVADSSSGGLYSPSAAAA